MLKNICPYLKNQKRYDILNFTEISVEKGWPIKIFKLKLCFPVSNLTYAAYWISYMSITGEI